MMYYATVRGKKSRYVGGIRRYMRKAKLIYSDYYKEAMKRADELIKYFCSDED